MRRSVLPIAVDELEARVLGGDFTRHGRLAAPLSGVGTDDRRTADQAGADLFVAVRGEKYDGHAALPKLRELGYRAAIGEITPLEDIGIPYYRVPNSRRALARFAFASFGNPQRALRVHGVTGTNGKSTTVRLLASILEADDRKVGWIGTVDRRIAGRTDTSTMTTPGPMELATLLADHVRGGGTDMVLEVSSHALDQDRVAGIRFASGLLTSFSRDHFDYHGDVESYLDAKLTLFERLAPGAPAILVDDPSVPLEHRRLRGVDPLRFGVRGAAVAGCAVDVDLGFETSRAEIEILGDRVEVETRLLGRHNVDNVVSASLTARALGVGLPAIRDGIARAPRVSGRLDPIDVRGARVFVDFAHTPDALAVVLGSLREITPERVVCVFGCGGDRDRGKRPEMGRIARRLADVCIVTSDNPRTEDPDAIIRDIVESDAQGFVVEADRSRAISLALSELRPGDSLLVAGKGHERTQVIGDQALPFDDRSAVIDAARATGEVSI